MKLPNNKKDAKANELEKKSKEQLLKEKEDTRKKTEEAKKIARSSQRVVSQYKAIEVWMIKNFKALSHQLDEIMMKPSRGKALAFIIAVVLVAGVSGDLIKGSFVTPQNSWVIEDVKVNIVNNSAYEVSGVPSTVDLILTGDLSDIQMVRTQSKYQVVLDLKGLSEGTHVVELSVINVSSRLRTTTTPSTVSVVLKKRTSQIFGFNYKFINESKKSERFILGVPTFDTNEVTITASQETLDQIASVEAIIDVANVTQTFERDVEVVAFNQAGQKMNVEVLPATVRVKVPVTSPSKEVRLNVVATGNVPNDKAIDEVSADHNTITIYGKDEILTTINQVDVVIDASQLTQDINKVTEPINFPSGVSSDIKSIAMTVKVGEKVSRVIEGLPINTRNNDSRKPVNTVDPGDNFASVTVTGTQRNIDAMTNDQIKVYIDVAGQPTDVDIEVLVGVENNGSTFVTLEIASKSKIRIRIGE